MDKYEYGQFGPEHYEKIQAGLELFNRGFYWECHEELEDHWLDDVGDQARLVYWAVIQVATSLYHFRGGNRLGAQGMMAKAHDKLQRIEEKSIETDLLRDLGWREFDELVRQVYRDQRDENYQLLDNFKFKLIESKK